jgi:hypothetical protein
MNAPNTPRPLQQTVETRDLGKTQGVERLRRAQDDSIFGGCGRGQAPSLRWDQGAQRGTNWAGVSRAPARGRDWEPETSSASLVERVEASR